MDRQIQQLVNGLTMEEQIDLSDTIARRHWGAGRWRKPNQRGEKLYQRLVSAAQNDSERKNRK